MISPPPVVEAKPQLRVDEKPQIRVEAKESYIASEWNDYTLDPYVARLAEKGTAALKGSEHEIEQKVTSNQKTTLTSVNNKPLAFV